MWHRAATEVRATVSRRLTTPTGFHERAFPRPAVPPHAPVQVGNDPASRWSQMISMIMEGWSASVQNWCAHFTHSSISRLRVPRSAMIYCRSLLDGIAFASRVGLSSRSSSSSSSLLNAQYTGSPRTWT